MISVVPQLCSLEASMKTQPISKSELKIFHDNDVNSVENVENICFFVVKIWVNEGDSGSFGKNNNVNSQDKSELGNLEAFLG